VIERNADAIVVVDSAGEIRFVNAAAEALFGKSRDEILLHPFGFPLVSGETTELELPQTGRAPRTVEMRVVETEWEEEPACLASLRDVTERKEAEEGARRLIRERAARAAAEQSARRMRFLADSLTLLASSTDYHRALASLAELCVEELADWAIVYGLSPEGDVARLEVAHRDPGRAGEAEEMRREALGPVHLHPVHEVLRTRRSLLIASVTNQYLNSPSRDPGTSDRTRRLGVSSFMIVPMIARDRVVGALSISSTNPERRYDENDVSLIEDLAHRAALAVDNAWLYARAQAAVQAQADLVAMISHDLRTPLSSMLGYADLLAAGIPEPLGDGSKKQVERIRASGQHLLYLIEQLLDFAKTDSERDGEGPAMQEVDAASLLRSVADLMEPLAVERGLSLRVSADGSAGTFQTDPGSLRRVLVNLAGNAVKFTEAGGVVLEVEGVDEQVHFRIRDTGIGIPAEHVDKIFVPFWRVPREDGTTGAGLGLSIVRRLVSQLGGAISVDSEAGRGTTFVVSLARSPAEHRSDPADLDLSL
jgi:signal transduction histidine kinase